MYIYASSKSHLFNSARPAAPQPISLLSTLPNVKNNNFKIQSQQKVRVLTSVEGVFEMDECDHEIPSVPPAGFHLKRRRGRPRKDHGFTREADFIHCKRRLGSTMLPQVEVKQCRTTKLFGVGQPIGGVIETVFDAGYLLKVELSSGTTLRGVVFKPGHFIPFSDENDVAPNAQMIRRNDVSFPSGTQIMCRGTANRTRGRHRQKSNGNGNAFHHSSSGAPVDHLPVIAASSISTSCKIVPMVLSLSSSLPNGIPPLSPDQQMMFSISKQLSPSTLESPPYFNGSAPCHLNQIVPYQDQSNVHFADAASPRNLSAIPFQQLFDEVRTQCPLLSIVTGAHKDASDLEEPLSAEPLQAIHPNHVSNLHNSDRKIICDGEVIELYQEVSRTAKSLLNKTEI